MIDLNRSCLVGPSFQGVNRLFAMSFGDNAVRTGHTRYFLPAIEIKENNPMNIGENYFYQSIKNDLRTYDNFSKNCN